MRSALVALLCLAALHGARAADYYVDAESRGGPADDGGPGSLESPWQTLSRIGADEAPQPQAGDTVWIRGGVYPETLRLGRGGAPNNPLTIQAYPDETPIIDGEGERERGILLPAGGNAQCSACCGQAVASRLPAWPRQLRAVSPSATRRPGAVRSAKWRVRWSLTR